MDGETIIERGFTIEDLNKFKIVNVKTNNHIGKKIKYENPKLFNFGFVKTFKDCEIPEHLKDIEYFEIPNPYDFTSEKFCNFGWNLEQCLLALKEGYADGFFNNDTMFGSTCKAIKCVNQKDSEKLREFFLNDWKDFIEALDKTEFTYVSIVSTSMREIQIGKSKDQKDDITNPETKKRILDSVINDAKKTNSFSKDIDYELLASRMAERQYYRPNYLDLSGKPICNYLEFRTMKEADDFAKWLRRSKYGAYCDENFINAYGKLVNNGFNEWSLAYARQKMNAL